MAVRNALCSLQTFFHGKTIHILTMYMYQLPVAYMVLILGNAVCQELCPSTWVRYGESCYLFDNVAAVHFTEAEHYCRQLGGDLVIIESSFENAFLRDFISRLKHENFWINLSDGMIEGIFRWNRTGSLPGFTDWGPGQPNDDSHNQDCSDFYHFDSGIHWNDRECTFDNYPLCEKNSTLRENVVTVVG